MQTQLTFSTKLFNDLMNSKPREYRAIYDGKDFIYYELVNLKENDDEYYRYLMDSYIESMMFDKTIEILDKENT